MTSEGNEALQRIHGSLTDRGVVDPLNVVCGVLTAVVFLEKRVQPRTYPCPKCEANDRRRIVRVGRVVIAGGEWSVDDLTQHTVTTCANHVHSPSLIETLSSVAVASVPPRPPRTFLSEEVRAFLKRISSSRSISSSAAS